MANFKYLDFYSRYVKISLRDIASNGEVMVKCPFHNDSNPSMSINVKTGFWKCQACDAGAKLKKDGTYTEGGGDAIHFLQTMHDLKFADAAFWVETYETTGQIGFPIDKKTVHDFHQDLLENKTYEEHLKYFMKKRLLTLETIKDFGIGIQAFKGQLRYTLPVPDENGYIVNVRKYAPDKHPKMINYAKGYGQARLYPLDRSFMDAKIVVLFEGELDALLARQNGIKGAITSTGGASKPIPEGTEHYFLDKVVYICMDADEAGRKGAQKAAAALYKYAKAIKICSFPEGMDYTDFIKAGNGNKEFAEILKRGEKYEPETTIEINAPEKKEDELEYKEVPLYKAMYDVQYHNQSLAIPVRVNGKGESPHTVPKTLEFKCAGYSAEKKKCQTCRFANIPDPAEGNTRVLEINLPRTADLINFVDQHVNTTEKQIRESAQIPVKCPEPIMTITESYNVERISITTYVEGFSSGTGNAKLGLSADERQTTQTAWHIYDKTKYPLATNQPYLLKGIRTVNPKDTSAIFLILEADNLENTLDNYSPTQEELEELKVFRPAPGQTIREKFQEIYDEFVRFHVVGVKQRLPLFIASDIVFHSILQFHFNENFEKKGLVEALIIGDTRTGKSKMGLNLMQHYQVGEYIDMGHARQTGLVGATVTLGSGTRAPWIIQWGKIPLNDRKMILLDEVSDFKDDLASLSSIRSEGVAEINKVKQERARARCRMIWVSNPRKNRHLTNFNPYGVWAIKDLIGAPEDIARFDFALGTLAGDVDATIIHTRNRKAPPESEQKYTSELCNRLVLWAWSRNIVRPRTPEKDQVIFKDDTTDYILKQAIDLSTTYSTSVPLVDTGSIAVKLARMSAAVAARLFSTDETMQRVVVKKEHAEFVVSFLHECYSSQALGYYDMSIEENRRNALNEQLEDVIFNFFDMYPEAIENVRAFNKGFSRINIEDTVEGADTETAKTIISTLHRYGLIYSSASSSSYNTSPKFTPVYRKWKLKKLEKVREEGVDS